MVVNKEDIKELVELHIEDYYWHKRETIARDEEGDLIFLSYWDLDFNPHYKKYYSIGSINQYLTYDEIIEIALKNGYKYRNWCDKFCTEEQLKEYIYDFFLMEWNDGEYLDDNEIEYDEDDNVIIPPPPSFEEWKNKYCDWELIR